MFNPELCNDCKSKIRAYSQTVNEHHNDLRILSRLMVMSSNEDLGHLTYSDVGAMIFKITEALSLTHNYFFHSECRSPADEALAMGELAKIKSRIKRLTKHKEES